MMTFILSSPGVRSFTVFFRGRIAYDLIVLFRAD